MVFRSGALPSIHIYVAGRTSQLALQATDQHNNHCQMQDKHPAHLKLPTWEGCCPGPSPALMMGMAATLAARLAAPSCTCARQQVRSVKHCKGSHTQKDTVHAALQEAFGAVGEIKSIRMRVSSIARGSHVLRLCLSHGLAPRLFGRAGRVQTRTTRVQSASVFAPYSC